jgi:hypothetical protein
MRTDHPNSMCAVSLHWTEDTWEAWRQLDKAIADPNFIAFDATHGGSDIWTFYAAHPYQEVQFNR